LAVALTLGFDVYGTLIDTAGVTAALLPLAGEQAPEFAHRWRDKQLEYSFRRGLMGTYASFADCTRQALAHTADSLGIALTPAQQRGLMEEYRRLPAFTDAASCLRRLSASGHRLFAFSNGQASAVRELLQRAGLLQQFLDIVSVEEVGSFKPDPAVYRRFLQRTESTPEAAWLVSANPFDVIGAAVLGLRTAWVRRSGAQPFDPWGVSPDLTLASLDELPAALPGPA
jgi:2-haloacid dehalogenase